MKIIVAFGLVAFLAGTVRAQQGLVIAPDSTSITFPQTPGIMVSRVGTGRNASFQISRKNFKALLATATFLQENYNLSSINLKACRDMQANRDSAVKVLEQKLAVETERTNLYKSSSDELKSVADTYNKELNNCKTDLDKLNRERKKSQRKAFIKGVLGGFAIGLLGGLTVAVIN